jgi:hypothetical protein
VIAEVLSVGLRLAHALAAALWVGASFVYLMAPPSPGVESGRSWRAVREALRIGIGVFVVTGAILTVQRLSSATLPPTYFAVLVLKVGLAVWLFSLGRFIGASGAASKPAEWWRRREVHAVAVGVTIYGLAMVLLAIYESALRG